MRSVVARDATCTVVSDIERRHVWEICGRYKSTQDRGVGRVQRKEQTALTYPFSTTN